MNKSTDLTTAIHLISSKARLTSLVKKLTDAQLNNVLAACQLEHADREEKQKKQAVIAEKRAAFFTSIKEQAAALNMETVSFTDFHSGDIIKVGRKWNSPKKPRKSYTLTFKIKYLIVDKEGYHYPWDGRGRIPSAFQFDECTAIKKPQYAAEKVVVLTRKFPPNIRKHKLVRLPSDFEKTLNEITPTQQGLKNAHKLLSKIKINDDET